MDIILSGIINVYKEKGYTSHDVVAILRRILKMKKIGHTGTLDPEAEGVLPVCIGKATKVADFVTNKKKVYYTTLQLGVVTDTQDHTGKVLEVRDVDVSESTILQTLKSFLGEIKQVPPMYSAIKVNGERLYKLARKGKTRKRKARTITIYAIEDVKIKGTTLDFRVTCSKGTYIRTLCHDIGEKLGCGAHMAKLVREQSGLFTLDSALRLEQIEKLVQENNVESCIMRVDSLFKDYQPLIVVSNFNKYLYNGNILKEDWLVNNTVLQNKQSYKVYDEEDNFIGVYNCLMNEKNEFVLKPIQLFI